MDYYLTKMVIIIPHITILHLKTHTGLNDDFLKSSFKTSKIGHVFKSVNNNPGVRHPCMEKTK